MNEELIKALKLALKTKGLSEELYEFINVENEGEISAEVDKLFGLMPKPPTLDIAKTLELPEFKKEVHRRITKAVNTFKANKGIEDEDDDPAPEDDLKDAPAWAKAMVKENRELKKDLEDLKTGKANETKQQQAAGVLKTSKVIPEALQSTYANRFDLNSETSFEDQLKTLEGEFTQLAQTVNNGKPYAGPPKSGENKDKPTAEQMDKIVGNI